MGDPTQPTEPAEPIEEPNLFKGTLGSAKTTIANARDAVYDGQGSPVDTICVQLTAGWQCTAGEDYVTDLKGATTGILAAFDDAEADVAARIASEPAKVPENDWRGLAWPRQWHIRRTNI